MKDTELYKLLFRKDPVPKLIPATLPNTPGVTPIALGPYWSFNEPITGFGIDQATRGGAHADTGVFIQGKYGSLGCRIPNIAMDSILSRRRDTTGSRVLDDDCYRAYITDGCLKRFREYLQGFANTGTAPDAWVAEYIGPWSRERNAPAFLPVAKKIAQDLLTLSKTPGLENLGLRRVYYVGRTKKSANRETKIAIHQGPVVDGKSTVKIYSSGTGFSLGVFGMKPAITMKWGALLFSRETHVPIHK